MPRMPFLGVSSLDLGRSPWCIGPFFFLGLPLGVSTPVDCTDLGQIPHLLMDVRSRQVTVDIRRDQRSGAELAGLDLVAGERDSRPSEITSETDGPCLGVSSWGAVPRRLKSAAPLARWVRS